MQAYSKLISLAVCLVLIAVIFVANYSVSEPTTKGVKLAEAGIHKPTAMPDRIVLTWNADPATTQSVTWRTDKTVSKAYADIAVAEDGPAFSGYRMPKGKARTTRVNATTQPLKTDLNLAHFHSVTFKGLKPKTKYLYRVGDGENWSEWFEFQTASKSTDPFSFIYFGDAQNDIKAHWSRVIRRAFRDAPDARFLIHAGDLINQANRDAEWGEWFAAGGWINGSVPSMPVPGNHEWAREEVKPKAGKRSSRRSISRHWRPQFTLPENGPKDQKELAYWFDYQGVRFVGLNSNERERSNADKQAQAKWLDQVLSDNPNRWTILTFHHPLYSPAKGRDNADLRKTWQPVIDKHQVDLVLQGHDHTYARSGLTVAEKNFAVGGRAVSEGGTVYAVSVSGPKMYQLNKKGWMKQSAQGKQLYQIIHIDGDKLRYEARTATGADHDVFELHKQKDGKNKLLEKAQLAR